MKTLAEACVSRTHRRRANPPPAGFEDRDDHRITFASILPTINSLGWLLSLSCCTFIARCTILSMKPRHQTGYIYESRRRRANGNGFEVAFYVRYRVTEIVNGQSTRVQKSEFLCDKSSKHPSRTSASVKNLRDDFMRKINGTAPQTTGDVSIGDFWEAKYLPYAEKNLRDSTVAGYRQIFNQHLKTHFTDRTLGTYRTAEGSQMLTALAESGLGRRTLAHIRSLASGIFTYAVNLGHIDSNPWHDVKILARVKAPAKTPFYTLEEVENVISALVDHVEAQAVVALAFFMGLRPGEIAGLQWNDVDEEWLHIRRAVVRGKVGGTKTPESVASLPLIQPVQGLLKLWRERSGSPSDGWVFPNTFGRPMDLRELTRKVIRPVLKKAKITYKPLYAGRRGAGTVLTQLTGNALAAQQILRHKNLAVTTGFYVKEMPAQGIAGMRLLEAAANGGKQ
jgi:integrase